MFSQSTTIRVHYALTDQMGVVYYGNYAQFFEIARTEAIRQLGITYKSLEAAGVMMPVSDMHIRYLRPVRYDELIQVKVWVEEWPLRRSITFKGEVLNEAGQCCTTSTITLYFVNAQSMRPVSAPEAIVAVLAPYFAQPQAH